MSGASIFLQAAGAIMQYSAGVSAAKAKREQYQLQARQERLQGRIDALNYKREGVAMLEEANKIMATNTARGSAGGIRPFETGASVDLVNQYALRGVANDFSIARNNASLAKLMSEQQAYQLELAGYNTVKSAKRAGAVTLGTQFGRIAAAGYSPSAGPYTGSSPKGIGGGSGAKVM